MATAKLLVLLGCICWVNIVAADFSFTLDQNLLSVALIKNADTLQVSLTCLGQNTQNHNLSLSLYDVSSSSDQDQHPLEFVDCSTPDCNESRRTINLPNLCAVTTFNVSLPLTARLFCVTGVWPPQLSAGIACTSGSFYVRYDCAAFLYSELSAIVSRFGSCS